MIVLILTIWHAIAELSLPAWQKEVRNIAHEVVEAMKEAKKYGNAVRDNDVMHEIFLLRHNKPEFACRIFNQLPEAFTLDVFTCQSSSSSKRKSTSCCGFMFFIKSTTCSGTVISSISLFCRMGNNGVPLGIKASVRFGFRWLCSINPLLPRPIIK